MNFQTFETFSSAVRENLTATWTGLTNAISASSELLAANATLSAQEAENFGRQMTELAADYARGVMNVSEGLGNAADRQALNQMGVDILNSIDNIRQSGNEAYARYGRQIANALSETRRAAIAEAGGAAVDLASLASKVPGAIETNDWREFGETAAGIGAATAAGAMVGAIAAALVAGIGITGGLAAAVTFAAVGLAAFSADKWLGPVILQPLTPPAFLPLVPGKCNRSHPLKKRRQREDFYGIVAKLADDLTDATRCT